MSQIVLKSGKIINARVLARTLFCVVLKDEFGKYLLLSKFALQDPNSIRFLNDK